MARAPSRSNVLSHVLLLIYFAQFAPVAVKSAPYAKHTASRTKLA
jgi:hypothetical protein